MARKRVTETPKMACTWWVKTDRGYTARREDVLGEAAKKGFDEPELRRALGRGYENLERLLAGDAVDFWSAYFIDHAVGPAAPPTPSWGPQTNPVPARPSDP